MKKMVYVNKGGQMHKGSKPDGMSDEEYSKMMAKKGYKAMGMDAYQKMKASKGHGSTEPDPKEDQKEPLNSGNPSAGLKKSEEEDEVEISDLTKALNQLTDLVKSNDPTDRKRELMAKSLNGETSDEEDAELLDLMKGGVEDETESLSKSVLAGLDPDSNEDISKSIEVSEYLKAHHSGTVDAVTELADVIEKSQAKSDQFALVLAKAIVGVGREVESLSKAINSWGEQPLSRPRSAQTQRQAQTKAMEKSFAGGAPEGSKLDRNTVLNILEALNQESFAKGMNGQSPAGEDLTMAIAKYENTNKMSKSLAQDVLAYAKRSRSAA